jgi:hypothetical protein
MKGRFDSMPTRNKYATAKAMLKESSPGPRISQYKLRRTMGAVWIERFMHILRDRGCNSPGLLTREWGDRRRRPGVEEAPWGGERNRFQHTTFPEDNPEIVEPR